MHAQDPPSWHPASDEVKAAAVKAKELCASKGTDLARIAIKHWLQCVTPRCCGRVDTLLTPLSVSRHLLICALLSQSSGAQFVVNYNLHAWTQDTWSECAPHGHGDSR